MFFSSTKDYFSKAAAAGKNEPKLAPDTFVDGNQS